MDDAEAEPEDADNLAALRKELKKLLAADAALREEVAGLLGGAGFQAIAEDGGVVVQGEGHVVAAHGGVAALRDAHVALSRRPGHPGSDEAGLRAAYLGWVIHSTRAQFLRGVDPSRAAGDRTPPQLEAVYTALLTETPRLGELGERVQGREPGWGETLSAVAQLDRHPRLVLLGDPGSGKSTFANFVAFCLASGRLDLLTAPLPDPRSGKRTRKNASPGGTGRSCCRCRWCCATSPPRACLPRASPALPTTFGSSSPRPSPRLARGTSPVLNGRYGAAAACCCLTASTRYRTPASGGSG